MGRQLQALPSIARAGIPLASCVASHTLLDSPVARIVQWRCIHDGDALRAERVHSTYVLSLISSGACRVHDGRWHATVDPVNALLHKPGSTYRTSHPYGCIDSGWNIAYKEEVAFESLERVGVRRRQWTRPAINVAVRPAALGLRQLIEMRRHRHNDVNDTIGLEELSLELLECVAAHAPAASTVHHGRTRREHQRSVEMAREYINSNCRRALNLGEVAREAGVSPAHLCRLFKQSTGLTLREYLHRLRLSVALASIARGNISLARAALDAGFCSQSHMTATCTRLYGLPPGELKQLI